MQANHGGTHAARRDGFVASCTRYLELLPVFKAKIFFDGFLIQEPRGSDNPSSSYISRPFFQAISKNFACRARSLCPQARSHTRQYHDRNSNAKFVSNKEPIPQPLARTKKHIKPQTASHDDLTSSTELPTKQHQNARARHQQRQAIS